MTVRIPNEASQSSDLMRRIHRWQRLSEAGSFLMRRIAVAALATAAALPMGTIVAHADSESYMSCAAMSLGHLGVATPVHAQQAEWDNYVTIGRNIDQNVHQNGASPQSQITQLEQKGYTHAVSGAIVQCALVNSPI